MDLVDRVRAFGRFYTTRTGLHARSFMGSPLGFSEARLLHDLLESVPGEELTARDLARGLGLDEGYVSRTLAAFARAGWIERLPDGADARRRRLRLTASGQAVAEDLRARSRDAVARLLEPLPAARREEAARTLDHARALLEDGGIVVPSEGESPAEQRVGLRSLRPGDAGWVLMRHGALYAAEEGYDQSFEAVVASILSGFLDRASPRERGWIAARGNGGTEGEERLGCLFVVEEPGKSETCRLRLVLVEPHARGLGLGQHLLDEAMTWTREVGYRRMVLWTHESHRAAGRLYARNGFTLLSATPARAFGQDVVDQTWVRDL